MTYRSGVCNTHGKDDDVALILSLAVQSNMLVWYENVSQAADQQKGDSESLPKDISRDTVDIASRFEGGFRARR